MSPSQRHLRLVAEPPCTSSGGASAGDLGIVAMLLAVGLVPVVSLLAGAGSGPGSAGAGTALALVAGRELWSGVRTRLRGRDDRA